MLLLNTDWRTGLWLGLLLLLILSSGGPQAAGLTLAGWWVAQQLTAPGGWQVVRRLVPRPRGWSLVRRVWPWVQAGLWLGLHLWLLGQWWTQPSLTGAWACLWVVAPVTAPAIRCWWGGLAGGLVATETAPASLPVAPTARLVEAPLDLEPLLAALGELAPTSMVPQTDRAALTAQIERIRAACYAHPVSRLLQERLDAEAQHLVQRVVEEALVQELDEYLGFGPYERTGAAKPAQQLRSGRWTRSLRTMWGPVSVRVPKLRQGNAERPWQVLERYERSFGPWLDLQLHLALLGLSQRDLQEVLQLSFGQVLSVKAIEHLTAVAQQEMAAFRQARLHDTPPALIADGVYFKVLCPTGTYRTNQRGQRRAVPYRAERVLLTALGVWPDGQYRLLDLAVVDQETKTHWKRFFRQLIAKGLDVGQLQLVVTDGRPGFHQAICAVFPQAVKHQRCIFHKLKNLGENLAYDQLTLDPDLPLREARQQAQEERARAILQEAAAIYAVADLAVIAQRLADFQQHWAALEPKAVRCFVQDFDLTLNYLRVPFPRKNLIRTTNLLERFFREFRTRTAEMGCFGSPAQAETWFYLIWKREQAKHAVA